MRLRAPKWKINFQTQSFIRRIKLDKRTKLKWSKFKKRPVHWQVLAEENSVVRLLKKKTTRRFSECLRSKQAVKHFYGFSNEKQFLNILQQCLKTNDPKNTFIELLESRLEVVLFRRAACISIFESRQIILHGKIEVCRSGRSCFKIVTRPTFQLSPGDVIRLPKQINTLSHLKRTNYFPLLFLSERSFCLIQKPNLETVTFPFTVNFHLVFDWARYN